MTRSLVVVVLLASSGAAAFYLDPTLIPSRVEDRRDLLPPLPSPVAPPRHTRFPGWDVVIYGPEQNERRRSDDEYQACLRNPRNTPQKCDIDDEQGNCRRRRKADG
jgi:hypothetical protein